MKKILIAFFALMMIAGVSGKIQAQKEFSGIVTYKVDLDSEKMGPEMAAMLPKFIKTMVRGNKTRMEMNMPMGSVINIQNGDTKEIITLMDMQGNKSVKVTTWDEISAKFPENQDITVREVNETMEIAGYDCKKAVVSVKEGEKTQRFTVYYSPELGNAELNFENPLFKDINGMLMQFELNDNGIELKLKATEVKKKRINKKMFEIPEEYLQEPKAEIEKNPSNEERDVE